MDAKIIEKLDKQRYWAVVLETVGLFLVMLECLWVYVKLGAEPNQMVIGGLGGVPFASPGLLLLAVGGIWYGIIWNKARRDKQTKDALYNELYMQHKYRYQRLSWWVMIIVSLLTIVLVSIFVTPKYPHIIITEMIVLAGLLTMKVSWLVFNRR